MKLLVFLGFGLSAWLLVAVLVLAALGSPLLAIASAVLAVLLFFAADHQATRLREREEDREYYGHPRL